MEMSKVPMFVCELPLDFIEKNRQLLLLNNIILDA